MFALDELKLMAYSGTPCGVTLINIIIVTDVKKIL